MKLFRNIYLSIVRCIHCIVVIYLHISTNGIHQFRQYSTLDRAQGDTKALSFLVFHRGNAGQQWTAVASGKRGIDRDGVPSSTFPLNSLSPKVRAGRSKRGTAVSASSLPAAANEAAAGVCAEVWPGMFDWGRLYATLPGPNGSIYFASPGTARFSLEFEF